MAYEFIAPITAETVPFTEIAERIQGAGTCCIESVTSSVVRFRWPDTPRREQWPEDAELSLSEDGLLLMVYSGTASQRSSLIEAISDVTAELINEPVVFEET